MDESPPPFPLDYHKPVRRPPNTAWADDLHIWGPGAIFCAVGTVLLVGAYVAYGPRTAGLSVAFLLSFPCIMVGVLYLAFWRHRVERRQRRNRRP
jgi:hypothetical protein